MNCPNCKKEMELLTVDEGSFAYYWCPDCGIIWEGEEGGIGEFRYPSGIEK